MSSDQIGELYEQAQKVDDEGIAIKHQEPKKQ